LTTQASAVQPLQRGAIGAALVGPPVLGVVFQPTAARLACIDGSYVMTEAFVRGVIAVMPLLLITIAARQSLRMPSMLPRPILAQWFGFYIVPATLFQIEKLSHSIA
jgi:hypothetical protein